jgi:hypothetical protein
MNDIFTEQIEQIVSRAIFHEVTCDCELHQKFPRLNGVQLTTFKEFIKTQAGFAFIMGVVSALCVENPNVLLKHLKCINEWTDKGVPF